MPQDFEEMAVQANADNLLAENSWAVVAMAKANRKYYEQLVESGFTPEQALELVKVHGLTFQHTGGN